MGKQIRIDGEAEADIADAMDWYESKRPGLGRELLEVIRAAIQQLECPGPECRPAIGVPRSLGVRRKLVKRFPYLVLFVEEGPATSERARITRFG